MIGRVVDSLLDLFVRMAENREKNMFSKFGTQDLGKCLEVVKFRRKGQLDRCCRPFHLESQCFFRHILNLRGKEPSTILKERIHYFQLPSTISQCVSGGLAQFLTIFYPLQLKQTTSTSLAFVGPVVFWPPFFLFFLVGRTTAQIE